MNCIHLRMRIGVLTLTLALLSSACARQSEPVELTGLSFPGSYPTAESAERLYDEMLFQRACQVVL